MLLCFQSKCENTIPGVTISNWHLWEYTTINGLKLNFMFQCKLIASLEQLPEVKIGGGNEINPTIPSCFKKFCLGTCLGLAFQLMFYRF